MIHFSHGNGFPSQCYRQLLIQFEDEFEVRWIDRIGHNPAFPVTENWHHLVEEVIYSIETQATQPVIAIGHSLGGVLSLIASIERPDLIKAVIMIDSPLLGRFKSSMVRLAKALGIIDRITPAFRTRGRRQHWKTREQVIEYLSERELFKTFTPKAMEDYVDYGLKKTSDGYELRFDRHIEYLIYRTLPHTLPRYERGLSIPTLLIYGKQSTVVDRFDIHYMKKHYGIEVQALPGTHMLPMESPQEVAHAAKEWLQQKLGSKL